MFWNTGRLDITEIHFFFFKRPVTDLFAEQIMTFSDYQVYAEKKKKKKVFRIIAKIFVLSLKSFPWSPLRLRHQVLTFWVILPPTGGLDKGKKKM